MTQQDIDRFFDTYKAMSGSFDLEKVHQLIQARDAKAMHPVKFNYKPFKFLMMTTAFLIGAATVIGLMTHRSPEVTTVKDPARITSPSGDKVTDGAVGQSPKSKVRGTRWVVAAMGTEAAPASWQVAPAVADSVTGIAQRPLPAVLNWPTDTVVDGRQFVVSLSNAELENLGFLLDSTGIYYNNIFNGKQHCFHSRFENGGGEVTSVMGSKVDKNKKEVASAYDFYPVYRTSVFFKAWGYKEEFDMANDTLLPVLLKKNQYRYSNSEQIIWMRVTPGLFDHLPVRLRYLSPVFAELARLKRIDPDRDVVRYSVPSVVEGLNLIHLNAGELARLGCTLTPDSVVFDNGGLKVKQYRFGVSNSFTTHKRVNEKGDTIVEVPVRTGIDLKYLTDPYGEPVVQWGKGSTLSGSDDFAGFMGDVQFLVPVVIRAEECVFEEDRILWFKPTEALFDSLPADVGDGLRREYLTVSTDDGGAMKSASTSCTYFEACKSTLSVADMVLYPNPAGQNVTIAFTLADEAKGEVLLVNIGGAKIKTLVADRTFARGGNSFAADLTDVAPGIYLVMVQTDRGFKTKRLIVSR